MGATALSDPARVAAVHASGLLDGPAHPGLDGLTRATARLLDVPLAAITLLSDEHQVFVSTAGPVAGRMPRVRRAEHALCRHVVDSGAALAVSDTRRNAITRDDSAALAEGVRAYAGVPVRAREGEVVGTLCAFHSEPRPFSPDELAVLTELAATASAAIELRVSRRADAAAERARLARVMQRDHLTGLPTRTMLESSLATVLKERPEDAPLVGVCVALDRFGLVNASFGQVSGDAVLCEVAARIAPLAMAPDLVARHGGDRFLLVSDREPEDVVQRLGAALARPFTLRGSEFHLGASTGVGLWPADGADAVTLLQHAEEALDDARRRTRGSVGFYRAPDVDARHRLTLTSRLRRALERDELDLHFQPIVTLCGDASTVPSFEALLRWNDAEHGMVPPDVFIPAAEDAGLIDALGSWVLERACRQVRAWAAEGLAAHIAINVSPRQLEHGLLPDQVAAALALCGVPRDRLSLELTESAVMREGVHADAVLHAVSELGVSLAIDDFGTGHSSLSRLRELPFSTLKLDRAFLAGVPHERQDADVVEAVLRLAEALGMTIVAEGVETEEQHAFLHARGCFAAQGWLYGRALPAEAATALLRRGGGFDASLRAG
ncbi:MAG TPA: GGDEF domain-containing protein [Solirubrobacteraceae bacterium]|nr:GGDEF domain-containing protein [Solirubrobacteraceae bacterium]